MRDEFKGDLIRIEGRVSAIEQRIVSKDDHKDHEERLRKLETFKERIMGVLVLGSMVGGAIVAGAIELIRHLK